MDAGVEAGDAIEIEVDGAGAGAVDVDADQVVPARGLAVGGVDDAGQQFGRARGSRGP